MTMMESSHSYYNRTITSTTSSSNHRRIRKRPTGRHHHTTMTASSSSFVILFAVTAAVLLPAAIVVVDGFTPPPSSSVSTIMASNPTCNTGSSKRKKGGRFTTISSPLRFPHCGNGGTASSGRSNMIKYYTNLVGLDHDQDDFFDFLPLDVELEHTSGSKSTSTSTNASSAATSTTTTTAKATSTAPRSASSSRSSSARPKNPTSYPDGDNLTKFKDDVLGILYRLRDEEQQQDQQLDQERQSHSNNKSTTKQLLSSSPLYRDRVPSYHAIWGEEEWKAHTSRWRYVRYMLQFPTSRLLRRVWPQMMVLLAWTSSAIGMSSRHVLFARFDIGLTSMGLVSTFVAALLTLRSNQGLSRLKDARDAFAKVIQYTREMNQLISVSVYPYDKQMGLLAARHVSCFCWSLMSHIRGRSASGSGSDTNSSISASDDVVSSMLPNKVDSDFINNYARKPPAAIIVRLRQILQHLIATKSIDKEVQKQLFQTLSKLNESLTVAERIKNSPMPPIYTAHLTRLLLFYLFWLPMSIHGAIGNVVATLVVTMAVGYAMLGLDEISHICELPFDLMPLRQLSKMSMVDSADAVMYQPPPLTMPTTTMAGGMSMNNQQHHHDDDNSNNYNNYEDDDMDAMSAALSAQIGKIGNVVSSGGLRREYAVKTNWNTNNNKSRSRLWI